jgi:TonB-linked SusC/RagA family outer membrane protein
MRKVLILLFVFVGCFWVETAFSQEIKGIVVDEKGEILVGASIKVVRKDGSAVGGTVADINGKYSVNVSANNVSLEFSYIGYTTRILPVSDKQALSRVVMSENLMDLSEVVVTGMTKIDKRLFTGSSAHLRGEDIKIDGIPDVSRALEGRVAGVSVQNVSGTFGSSPKILVRGATSIYGNSQPLWVVDGAIVENVVEIGADQINSGDAETVLSSAIAGLNASDIATWDVLKDAAATSIYGAKAKSGVIVITTKKGRSGKSVINYTGEFSTRLIPSYSDFNVMNSQDQMGVYQEMEQKGWLNFSQTFRDKETGVYGKMYQLMSAYDPTKGTFALQNTEAAKMAYLREAEYRNTDWFGELFNNSVGQNHALSLSGGNDKSTYRASMSIMDDPGWYKQSNAQRYTVSLKLDHKIAKNLDFEMAPRVSYRKQRGPGTLGRTTNVVYGEVGREFDINPYMYALNTSRTLDPSETYTRNYAPFNIFDELDNNYMDYNLMDMTLQGQLTWGAFKGFDVTLFAATNYQMSSMEHNITDFANQAMAYRAMPDAVVRDANSYLYRDPDVLYALPITVLPYGGIYYRQDNKAMASQYRLSANYTTNIRNEHILSLFGSAEMTSADKDRTWFRGWGRQYSMGDVPAYAYEVFKKGLETGADYYGYSPHRDRSLSFTGNANYSYKGKYNLMGTVRYDGSNRLGKARSARWLPTWNMGAAWNVHEESFFESWKPTLSHLKVFGSYGLTADRGTATNSQIILRAQTAWRPEISAQEPSIYISSLENSELTYEKKTELNLGLEFGLLNNRLYFDFQHFRRHNFDLIGRIDVMGIGGDVQKIANVAEMDSRGWEATVSTKNIDTKDFRWTTSLVFSDIRLKITSLKNDQRVIDLISNTGGNFGLVGDPRQVIYSIPFAGLDEDGFPTFYNENGDRVWNVYLQNKENLEFLKYEGSADPTTFGSLGNLFNYKNFRLNFYVTYSFGNKIRLDKAFSRSYTDFTAMPKEFRNRWVLPGDENYTNIPVIASTRQTTANTDLRYAYNIYNYSDVRVADGGFIRMKEISIAYDVPKKLISKASLNNLSLKLQGTNLFLLYADSKLNGQDPEFNNSGGVASPMAKQITFTISLGL